MGLGWVIGQQPVEWPGPLAQGSKCAQECNCRQNGLGHNIPAGPGCQQNAHSHCSKCAKMINCRQNALGHRCPAATGGGAQAKIKHFHMVLHVVGRKLECASGPRNADAT